MRNTVVVVGSYNTDLTIRAKRIPSHGETVIGGILSEGGGGKGANQAIAAARAGAEVRFVARVGNDAYGGEGLRRLMADHIDTRHVVRDPELSTGIAFIVVDERGENSIVVATGANGHLCPSDIEQAHEAIQAASVLLVQLESPLPAVQAAIHAAGGNGALVILNPAPAQALTGELLRDVNILTPNKLEAEMITGMAIADDASLHRVAQHILEKGVDNVMITLGRRGVFVASANGMELIPAYKVRVVDSTGAGDVFSGSLAAFLAGGMNIEEAAKMAIASSSLSVTRMGAQLAAPLRSEVESFIQNYVPSSVEAIG